MAGIECVILAGGFARRLLPLTERVPKPLLPVAGRPILSYIIEKLRRVTELGRCYLTTNRRFAQQFSDFIASECRGLGVELFIEDAESEGQKLGSVAALGHIVSRKGITKDTMVIGGDNLFDLELSELASFQRSVRASVLALYDVGSRERASLYGVVELDQSGRVVSLVEKPREPPSTLVSTACYIFTGEDIALLRVYLEGGNPRDAAGHFVSWLSRRRPVHGLPFTGMWYDIGSLESYKEADRFMRERIRATQARGAR